jgi:hypothetical protein
MYGFWLPLWYLLVIVLSVRLLCTASVYLFGIFWSLCCLFFFYVRLLITSLVSFGHCIFCSTSMYGFWLPIWYHLVIVFSVQLLCTASDYLFGIFWSLCCLFFFYVRLLFTSLVDNTMTKRYQIGKQKPYIEDEQTTQWPKDTKEVIRSRT